MQWLVRGTNIFIHPGRQKLILTGEIEIEDRDENAFTSHHRLYRFVQILFGLKNAPGIFQWTIDVIWASVNWQNGLVYFEN